MSPSDRLRLAHLAARGLAGRRFWLLPSAALLWPLLLAVLLVTGARAEPFTAASVQNALLAVPLLGLAIGLGVRVIAGEVDGRTLEIAYTVPGGCHRLWLAKLGAAAMLLLGAELLAGLFTFAFLTPVPAGSLYGAFQAAAFYLVLSMGLAALARSEVAGAMMAAALLALNLLLTGFGSIQSRFSPLFNPRALPDAQPAELLAWTVQNRLGFALAITALAALAFARAERREAMLAG